MGCHVCAPDVAVRPFGGLKSVKFAGQHLLRSAARSMCASSNKQPGKGIMLETRHEADHEVTQIQHAYDEQGTNDYELHFLAASLVSQ